MTIDRNGDAFPAFFRALAADMKKASVDIDGMGQACARERSGAGDIVSSGNDIQPSTT
jgi:hypothetical protein